MKKEKIVLLIIHYVIIINLVIQIFYGGFQVFVVLAPGGQMGPLFGTATTLDYESMVVRRLYAIETWIAIVGLSIYLAITEVNPRMKKLRDE